MAAVRGRASRGQGGAAKKSRQANRGTVSVSDRKFTTARRGATRRSATAALLPGFIAGLLGGWLGAAPAALAGEDDPAFITFGAGYYDAIEQEDGAADFRLEYRHNRKLWILKPWAGIEATSDGAVYGVAGVLIDVYFGRRFVVTPSVGVGAYAKGDGGDLGSAVEFRSQIELAYRFDDRSRLGVAFGHISNAGIDDRNPGVEIVSIYYSLPIGSVFGE